MIDEFTGDDRTNNAVGAARAHSGDPGGAEVIGTHHLLIGLSTGRSGARDLLEGAELTHTVLVTVLRSRRELWARDEGAPAPVRFPDIGKTEQVSGAAIAALERYLAGGRQEPESLLAAVLHDEDALAATVVRECGADLSLLRRAVVDPSVLRVPDRVPAGLAAMRDRLLGRTKYGFPGLRNLSLAIAVASRPNWAQTPVMWIKLEADERARQRGGARTDDLLVALLAAYEVASAYPHLLAEAAPGQYDGARALAEAGLRAEELASASATLDLGADAVGPRTLLKPGRSWPADTSALLERLLAHDDNRSVRLLRELGADLRALRR